MTKLPELGSCALPSECILIPLLYSVKSQDLLGFPDSSVGKESACNAGDPGLIPGSGRSAGEGIGYPLQYSGLENSMDYAVHGVAKSQTQLSDLKKKTFHLTTSLGFHFTFCETSMYV